MRSASNPRTPFTTRIKIKDKQGRVIEEKEVPTFAGLLNRAHDEGLTEITAIVVQSPSKDNGMTAIVLATVKTRRGSFAAVGDATPENVNARISPHFIRMADTRAKARALREALNIGAVTLEEFSGNIEEEVTAAGTGSMVAGPPPSPERAANDNGRPQQPGQASSGSTDPGMSDAQRRLLFRIAGENGVAPEHAKAWLEQELGVPDLRELSRSAASTGIDQLRSRNGAGRGGAPNGAPS